MNRKKQQQLLTNVGFPKGKHVILLLRS